MKTVATQLCNNSCTCTILKFPSPIFTSFFMMALLFSYGNQLIKTKQKLSVFVAECRVIDVITSLTIC